MMSDTVRVAVAGLAFYLATAATAEAAKGVKKVGSSSTPRMFTGVVVSVNPNGTGTGTFHIRTMHHHRKLGMNNLAGVAGAGTTNGNNGVNTNGVNNGGVTHHIHEFNVTSSTQFMHHNGTPASAALLHTGERVRVRAVGNQTAANQTVANAASGSQVAGSQVAGRHQAMAVQYLSHLRMPGRFTRHRGTGYYPHFHHRRRF